MDDPDLREETVIGHHVAAKRHELNPLIDKGGPQRAFPHLLSPKVTIEVGDVDWDETKTVTVRLSILREIVEQFDAESH